MINIPNTTIQLPNYAEQETLERLSTPVVITKERREKGIRCCAKLRAIINGEIKPNSKAEINKADGKQLAEESQRRQLIENIVNMTPTKRQEYL